MSATTGSYEVRVRIEDTADVYVGEAARAAMQDDARRQLHTSLYEAVKLYEAEFDQADIKAIGELTRPLTRALEAAKALQALAPLPEEADDDD